MQDKDFSRDSKKARHNAIIRLISEKSVETGVKVLAGDYPAKGVMTYDVKLK